MTDTLQKKFLEKDFTPDVEGTFENREHGGLTLDELVQELDDNSKDAGASTTHIHFNSVDGKDASLHEFIIRDNGCGMNAEKLFDALRLSLHHTHAVGDTGKFGDGLKNATYALGNTIRIVSKMAGQPAVGVHLDLGRMKENKTFRPTSAGAAATYMDSFPSPLWTLWSAQASGTMVSVREIKPAHMVNVEMAAALMRKSLSLANSTTRNNSVYIHTNMPPAPAPPPTLAERERVTALTLAQLKTELSSRGVALASLVEKSDYVTALLCAPPPMEHVTPLDPFYRAAQEKLEAVAETELLVYTDAARKVSIYERLTGNRIRGNTSKKGAKEVTGTPDVPLYFKLSGTLPEGRGKRVYADEFHQPCAATDLPTGTPLVVKLRFIKVAADVYLEEGKTAAYADVSDRRRGFWFYRGSRLVGAARNLGMSLDDHYNRIRAEVIFPGELDKMVGMRTQKQIGNHLATASLQNALILLWRQVANAWSGASVTDETGSVSSGGSKAKVKPKAKATATAPVMNLLPVTVKKPEENTFPGPPLPASPLAQRPIAEVEAEADAAEPETYNSFVAAQRPSVKEANPNFTPQQCITELARLWQLKKAQTQAPSYQTNLKAKLLPFRQSFPHMNLNRADDATEEEAAALMVAMKTLEDFFA